VRLISCTELPARDVDNKGGVGERLAVIEGKTYTLPPSTQFCPHLLTVFILQHKSTPLVFKGGIVKWMVLGNSISSIDGLHSTTQIPTFGI